MLLRTCLGCDDVVWIYILCINCFPKITIDTTSYWEICFIHETYSAITMNTGESPSEKSRGPDPEDLEETFNTFRRVMGSMHRRFRSNMTDHGVTPSQFLVMKMLGSRGRMGTKEIAELLDVTPGNVTGIIDRLERDGLVYRNRGSQDRRTIHIRLTEAGSEKMEELIRSGTACFSEMFEGWSDDDLKQLRNLLNNIRGVGDEYAHP